MADTISSENDSKASKWAKLSSDTQTSSGEYIPVVNDDRWIIIASQDSDRELFSETSYEDLVENPDDPNAGAHMVVGLLDQDAFRDEDGYLTLMLQYWGGNLLSDGDSPA